MQRWLRLVIDEHDTSVAKPSHVVVAIERHRYDSTPSPLFACGGRQNLRSLDLPALIVLEMPQCCDKSIEKTVVARQGIA